MKPHLLVIPLIFSVYSDYLRAEACDPDEQDCSSTERNVNNAPKDIYPNRPMSSKKIKERISFLTENPNYVGNIYQINQLHLESAKAAKQPWSSTFWPLNQGLIANNYQDKDYDAFLFSLLENVNWTTNYSNYLVRQRNVHARIDSLSEDELAKLAPSEKYDLLLGDKSFDLTNRMWSYTKKWGEQKQYAFFTKIDIPENYVLVKKSKNMALWEGVCHGWAIAAGHTPRPEKAVWVKLPSGKKMPFYPEDIKGLISLMWGNSLIQDRVMFEGNRCNRKLPSRDQYGRYVDNTIDRDDTELLPRCADTHPAIFHGALVNIMGMEKRSFVIDHKTASEIGNQPLASYSYVYFNPKTGKDADLKNAIISVKEYGEWDPFASARNPETTHIVGIDMRLIYIDWTFPHAYKVNDETYDKKSKMDFMYDLELNSQGEIIGGQWRMTRRGYGAGPLAKLFKLPNWPDYFWVAPKNWKTYFTGRTDLPKWDFYTSNTPPKEYLPAALNAHEFMYEKSARFNGGVPHKCAVFSKVTGERKLIDCESKIPWPQPLINVVNTLLEESRR